MVLIGLAGGRLNDVCGRSASADSVKVGALRLTACYC